MESRYTAHGYTSRQHFLECLAEDYDVSIETVWTLADTLGPEEDFDGLVTAIEEFVESWN